MTIKEYLAYKKHFKEECKEGKELTNIIFYKMSKKELEIAFTTTPDGEKFKVSVDKIISLKKQLKEDERKARLLDKNYTAVLIDNQIIAEGIKFSQRVHIHFSYIYLHLWMFFSGYEVSPEHSLTCIKGFRNVLNTLNLTEEEFYKYRKMHS